jgi:hypothetical protein
VEDGLLAAANRYFSSYRIPGDRVIYFSDGRPWTAKSSVLNWRGGKNIDFVVLNTKLNRKRKYAEVNSVNDE